MRKNIAISQILGICFTILFVLFLLGQCFQYSINIYILSVLSIIGIIGTRNNFEKIDIKILFATFLLFVYSLTNALLNNGGIGSAFTIVSGIIVFFAFKNITITERERTIIVCTAFITNLYWIIHSNGYYDLAFINHWLGDGSMTNSNTVGKFICYTAILIYILCSYKKRVMRWISYLIIVMSFYGIYNCRARISIIVLALFITFDFIFRKFPRLNKSNIYLKIFYAILLLVTIFPLIYIAMYTAGVGRDIEMFDLSAKGLYSGRETIWLKAFNGMNNIGDWVFGVGSNVDYWQGHILNMHNNAMNLLVVIGIFGLVFYCILLTYIIKKYCAKLYENLMTRRFFLFFLCILFEGISDITIFYNTLLLYYFAPLGMGCNIYIQFKNREGSL